MFLQMKIKDLDITITRNKEKKIELRIANISFMRLIKVQTNREHFDPNHDQKQNVFNDKKQKFSGYFGYVDFIKIQQGKRFFRKQFIRIFY